MWRDHPICQRNKTTERAVKVGIGGDREGGGVGQNLKRGSGGLGNIGGDLHKIVGGLGPLCQLWFDIFYCLMFQ